MLKNIILFLFCLVLTSGVIKYTDERLLGRIVTTNDDEILFLKLNYFARHKDEFDAVFVGSSLVFNHIDPLLFDQSVQNIFPGFKSYNLAFPQGSYYDVLYVLDYLNKIKPKKLKYVFIEPRTISFISADNITSKRVIKTHTFNHTFEAIGNIYRSETIFDTSDKIKDGLRHLQAYFYNMFSVGSVYYWHEYFINQHKISYGNIDVVEKKRGYEPTPDDENADQLPKRKEFLSKPDIYSRAVDRKKNGIYFKAKKFDEQHRVINKFTQLAHNLKAEPVFIIMPAIIDSYLIVDIYDQLPKTYPGTLFINYDDPVRYPEYFDVKNKFDFLHLNMQGAQILTNNLAKDFLLHIEIGSQK